jgi:hypothetical protein
MTKHETGDDVNLELVDGMFIELDGIRVAQILPNIGPSTIYRLQTILDDITNNQDLVAWLEHRVEELERDLKTEDETAEAKP